MFVPRIAQFETSEVETSTVVLESAAASNSDSEEICKVVAELEKEKAFCDEAQRFGLDFRSWTDVRDAYAGGLGPTVNLLAELVGRPDENLSQSAPAVQADGPAAAFDAMVRTRQQL